MTFFKRKNLAFATLFAVLALVVATVVWVLLIKARPTAEINYEILTIGTADSGGTMYPVGQIFAETLDNALPLVKVNTGASQGSLSNIEALRTQQIDLALVSGDVAFCAYNGTKAFRENPLPELRAITAVYTSYSNWMAANSLEAEFVHDLLGKRIAVGPEDSTTFLSSQIALEAVGINSQNTTLENYGLGSGSEALKASKIDAVHGLAGIPVSGMSELAEALPVRLLKYTPEELDAIVSGNPQYIRTVIPKNTYPGQTEEIETFGVKCILAVSADMDDEMVYQITKILNESTAALAARHPALAQMNDLGFAFSTLGIPLHPGARRYYQNSGMLAAEEEGE